MTERTYKRLIIALCALGLLLALAACEPPPNVDDLESGVDEVNARLTAVESACAAVLGGGREYLFAYNGGDTTLLGVLVRPGWTVAFYDLDIRDEHGNPVILNNPQLPDGWSYHQR